MLHMIECFEPASDDHPTEAIEVRRFHSVGDAIEAYAARVLGAGSAAVATLSLDSRAFDSLGACIDALNAGARLARAHPEVEDAASPDFVEDIDYWAEQGVFTPRDLARHIAAGCDHPEDTPILR